MADFEVKNMDDERRKRMEKTYSDGLESTLKGNILPAEFIDIMLLPLEFEVGLTKTLTKENNNLKERLQYLEKEMAKTYKSYVQKYGKLLED